MTFGRRGCLVATAVAFATVAGGGVGWAATHPIITGVVPAIPAPFVAPI